MALSPSPYQTYFDNVDAITDATDALKSATTQNAQNAILQILTQLCQGATATLFTIEQAGKAEFELPVAYLQWQTQQAAAQEAINSCTGISENLIEGWNNFVENQQAQWLVEESLFTAATNGQLLSDFTNDVTAGDFSESVTLANQIATESNLVGTTIANGDLAYSIGIGATLDIGSNWQLAELINDGGSSGTTLDIYNGILNPDQTTTFNPLTGTITVSPDTVSTGFLNIQIPGGSPITLGADTWSDINDTKGGNVDVDLSANGLATGLFIYDPITGMLEFSATPTTADPTPAQIILGSGLWTDISFSVNSSGSIVANADDGSGTSEVFSFNDDNSVTETTFSGPDGTGDATKTDQENANGTSRITIYSSDGSSKSTYYTGPSGTGSVTEIDQENADGTSEITTYGSGGSTITTSYEGPNGTSIISNIDIITSTDTISLNISAIEYIYTGTFIFGSVEDYPQIGSAGSIVLNAGGLTFTDFEENFYTAPNGQVESWALVGYYPVDTNNFAAIGNGNPGSGYVSEVVIYNNPPDSPISYINYDAYGSWSANTSSIEYGLEISPNSGQTEQLASVLQDPNLIQQGILEILTIGGLGIVELKGVANIPELALVAQDDFVIQAGTLNADAITIDADGSISGFGTMTGAETLNGTAMAIGGTLDLTGDISGSGNFVIDSNAALLLEGTVAATEGLSFTGSEASLIIGTASSILAPISGFAAGDFIEIEGESVTAAAYSSLTDDLTLTASSGTSFILSISGTYQQSDFFVSNGEVTIACFASGTRILTPVGEVPVEHLSVDDAVITYTGEISPIKWMGYRRINLVKHPRQEAVQPILICAGAITHGVPQRDLIVSPDHAFYLDGYLVPAKVLANGKTIKQLHLDAVTYYHVELSQHAVLFAEGALAESYLETGNRGAFENGGPTVTLHPDFAQMQREVTGCAPFVESGAQVEAIRQRLLDRANIQTTNDPGLAVEYHHGNALIQSRHAIPGLITPDPRDRRRLGVKVASIIVGGRHISFDHPALVEGWHDAEPDGRWTDGSAVIPAELLAGANDVSVILVATLPYPIAA